MMKISKRSKRRNRHNEKVIITECAGFNIVTVIKRDGTFTITFE